MKKTILSFLIITCCNACFSQTKFKEFVNEFEILALPLNNIPTLNKRDTLNGKFTNDIIIRSQNKKPQFLNKDGNIEIIKHYYGLYPEEPLKYGYRGEQLFFHSKITPIGRVSLDENYISLIIKVVDVESTFYDLWNFSKDGEVLSVVCLFWGLRDAGPRGEEVTFIIVNSEISIDGNVIWHENDNGLETFRTYELSENGLFKIIREEQQGEYEF